MDRAFPSLVGFTVKKEEKIRHNWYSPGEGLMFLFLGKSGQGHEKMSFQKQLFLGD